MLAIRSSILKKSTGEEKDKTWETCPSNFFFTLAVFFKIKENLFAKFLHFYFNFFL